VDLLPRKDAEPQPTSPVTVLLTTPRNRVSARYRRLGRLMFTTDAGCLLLAMLLTYLGRFGTNVDAREAVVTLIFGAASLLTVFKCLHLNEIEHLWPAEEFRRLVIGVGISAALLGLMAYWTETKFSRGWLAMTWVFATFLILLTRQLWHRRLGRMRNDGRLQYRTLVVSGNGDGVELAEMITSPGLGFLPVGIYDPEGFLSRIPHEPGPADGRRASLFEAIDKLGVECMFVSSASVSNHDLARLMKTARIRGLEVRLSANLPDILANRLMIRPLGNFLTVAVKRVRLTTTQRRLRRLFDLVLASLAILFLMPVWLAIAVAVKTTSRGPVLYRQTRVGRGGKHFKMIKFRTMVKGADGMTEALIDLNHANGPLFKIPDDPRITRVGKVLRKYSLDELPQLLNVLSGDMSLVGPRPPLPAEVSTYEDWHYERLAVTPGMTGLWQVSGRSDLPFEEYVRLDLFYIENWSVSYDLYILAKTIPVVVSGKGSY
jgi:exopolysaccharide biosynthesis polyprenyl glycosylphosphotransferase